ncbi:MAG: TetR/AcrR family transcriptional regulator [Oceanicaulis sp.]
MNGPGIGFRKHGDEPRTAVEAGGGPLRPASVADPLFERVRRSAIARFSAAPFHKVGMRAIARDAGAGMATLYEVAGGKDALLQACLAPDFEARLARVAAASRREVSCRSRLRACIAELIAFELDRPEFARIIRLNTPAQLMRDADADGGLERVFIEILRRGVREGALRTDIPADALACMVQALTDGALARWAAEAGEADRFIAEVVQARTDRLFSLLWPAICAG